MMMQMSKQGGKKIKKLVMLSEHGLAIHKGVNTDNKTWVISHFNSGKSILTHIKERKDVEEYVVRLVEILPSWNFTLEEWDDYSSDEKSIIKVKVDVIQKEITIDMMAYMCEEKKA